MAAEPVAAVNTIYIVIMKIFRNTTLDSFLILYLAIALVSPFAIAFLISNYIIWVLLVPFQAIFLVIAMNTSLHYHMHSPLFLSSRINRLYEIFASMVIGIPFTAWRLFHIAHHKHNNDLKTNGQTKDPLSFYRYGENYQRENFWAYCITGVWRDISGKTIKDPSDNCSTKVIIKNTHLLKTEQYAFYCFVITIFLFNFWYGFLYILIYVLSLILNNATSYGEHFGSAVEQNNFRVNSVSSYGKLYNFFCFNCGYHQEHHVRPNAHWTDLPKITKTLPSKRHIINKMYMFNAPWFKDLINK